MSISLIKLPYQENVISLAYAFQHNELALLDSPNTSHPDGRWSILAANPIKSVSISTNQKTEVETFKREVQKLSQTLFLDKQADNRLNDLPFTGGAIGIASYDLGITDSSVHFSPTTKNQQAHAVCRLYPWCFLWDHHLKEAYLVVHENHTLNATEQLLSIYRSSVLNLEAISETSDFQNDWDFKNYENAFLRVQQYIQQGDVYQINLAQKYTAQFKGSSLNAYSKLRDKANAPFSAYWEDTHFSVASCSPERFIRIRKNQVETKPIKGTRPNTGTQDVIQELISSTKDAAENLMIVDLLRNDLSKHCTEVKVPKLFAVESFPTVHHLVSTISATKTSNTNNLDIFWDAFPGGSITGAPKKRAMEIISEIEGQGRSFYCGSIFYQSSNGNFDSNILIRSFVFNGHSVSAWAGGGVVADSTVEDEYQECTDKIHKLMTWLG